MPDRFEFTEMYDRGWEIWDADMVKRSLAEGFIFDDPALPEPITRDTIGRYMAGWQDRVRSIGGTGDFTSRDLVRADVEGALITWHWWRFEGTRLEGSAVTRVTDRGVLYERITYYPTTPKFDQEQGVASPSE